MISLLITLAVIGVILYLVNTLLPMDGTIKKVINVLVGLCVLLYVLQFFGVWTGFSTVFKR
jgi:hypothetical protein